jgi:hypothetical protein
MAQQQPDDPGKLVFIDEARTKTTMTRLEGRAERGKRRAVREMADFDQRRDVSLLRRAEPSAHFTPRRCRDHG